MRCNFEKNTSELNDAEKQIEEGRQAYVVCPLVEENEEMDLKSVEKLYEMYSKEIFSQYIEQWNKVEKLLEE